MDITRIKQLYPKLEGALWRGWCEVHFALNARKLLLEIHEVGEPKNDSRKGLIFVALDDNVRLRLVRLLDCDSRNQSAGFAYIRRCWPQGVEEVALRHGLALDALDDLGSRLKNARDLTFVHIDKGAIGKAGEIWKDKPIEYHELDSALDTLRVLYSELYREITGNRAPYFDLVGELPTLQTHGDGEAS